jgi:hypothetical protein
MPFVSTKVYQRRIERFLKSFPLMGITKLIPYPASQNKN